MIARNDSTQLRGERAKISSIANFVWLVILVLAGIGGSLVISCVTPFVALAVALAGTVRLATALWAMSLIWLTNQFIGFVFFHFPCTLNAALRGLAVGGGALLSTVVASRVIKHARSCSVGARLSLAFFLGYAAYEITVFVAILFLGGAETFSPAIIAQLGLNNAVWLAVIIALNELAMIICKPRIGKLPRLARAN